MKFKKLFSTPKRIIATVSISLLSLGILGTVSVFTVYAVAENSSIGKETAINNAYAAAGITSEQVDAVETKFKFHKGKFVYDIEFYSDGEEYEYKINSKNGSVVEFEHPRPHKLPDNIISIEEAKSIALNHAGVNESDATFKKAKLDRDDGRYEYEIEFDTAEKRYEYNISAIDGTVIKTEIKPISSISTPSTTPENLISVEDAKSKALSHAALTEAYFTKTRLVREDGTFVYEIKFTADNLDYKYKVSAEDGTILKAEKVKSAPTDEKMISVDDAKSIALSHGGFSEESVKFIKAELDKDDGAFVYEIELSFENKKYEYTIDAHTGDIIKTESEIYPETLLGIEKAKEICLTHSGIAKENAIFRKSELDKDDGIYVYEIEFHDDNQIFEYEINASNGDILEVSKKDLPAMPDSPANPTDPSIPANPDSEKPTPPSVPQNPDSAKPADNTSAEQDSQIPPTERPDAHKGMIGIDKAKEKALEKISAKENDVTFTKAKLDYDDGVSEYEIELIHQGKKHEFSINPITGEIHEFEID